MLDFMQRRGRVLKKMGALTSAAEVVDAARQMDKADRYMNSKVLTWLLEFVGPFSGFCSSMHEVRCGRRVVPNDVMVDDDTMPEHDISWPCARVTLRLS